MNDPLREFIQLLGDTVRGRSQRPPELRKCLDVPERSKLLPVARFSDDRNQSKAVSLLQIQQTR
jgi:hypothetical protein